MSPNSESNHDDLMPILDGHLFDQLYANSLSMAMLVDATESDPDYPKILRVNPEFTRNIGYRPEEAVGRSTKIFLCEQTDRVMIKFFRKQTRRLKSARGDILIKIKSGATRWMEAMTSPFVVNDRIIYLLTYRDISARKEIEDRLNERTALLQRAERLGGIGHWTWNLLTDDVFWSDEIYRIHGLDHTDDARRGRPIDYYHDEDRALFKRHLNDARRNGKDFEFDLRVAGPDGATRFVTAKGYCKRGADGAVAEIFGVFQDFTETETAKARAETDRKRFKDALESIAGGVLVLDRDDRLVMMNRHYSDAFPELRDVAPPGTPFREIIRQSMGSESPRGPNEDAEAHFEERLRRHLNAEGVEAFQAEDGRWYRIEEHRMSDGGILLIRLDITDNMLARQALLEAKNAAEFASRSKSDFLANMSHELRTPLNAIIGFGELLGLNLHGELGATSLQYVRDIVNSGEHLLAIINDILDLSKIEVGAIILEKAFEDVGTLIESTVLLVRQAADENDTTINVEVPKGQPRLYCDGLRIKQIILNLMSNAVKFKPRGSVTITSEVIENALWLKIADTGIGMKPDDLEIALTPFGQVDESHLTRRYEGTGLGLPLAKRLTELHGGIFSIDSALGEGTVVHLKFPLGAQDEAPSGP